MLKWIGRIFLLWCAGGLVAFVWFAMPHLLHSTSRAANFAELLLVSLALEIAQFTTIGAMMMGRRSANIGKPWNTTSPFKQPQTPGKFPAGVQQARPDERGRDYAEGYDGDTKRVLSLLSDAHNLVRAMPEPTNVSDGVVKLIDATTLLTHVMARRTAR